MCGIVGLIGSGNKLTLIEMNHLIEHRGPDDEGYFIDESASVYLAMRRLSIIDLETGKQPIFNEDNTITIVFNGEIYNYRNLRERLIKQGHQFRTHSDTETILHGYEEFGESIVDHLHGMFAFAIWDSVKKCLFCARDRIGIKPFYYHSDSKRLVFGSEQKAVIAGMNKSVAINRLSLIQHLLIGFNTGPITLFSEIVQLPPGHVLIWSNGKLTIKEYWRLIKDPAPPLYGEQEATDLLRAHIDRSVLEHLESDVPVALTLSGGLDSSILAMQMGKCGSNTGSMHSYTIGYGHDSDEIPYARLLAKQLREISVFPHERIVDPKSVLRDLPEIVWHLEEPLSNITAITAFQWAKFIAEKHKVTLVGEGADELFGGYFYHRLFTGPYSFLPFSLQRVLYRFAFLQPPMSLLRQLMGGGKKVIDELDEVYHLELRGRICSEKNRLRGILRFDTEFELSNNQLLRIDKMTMAHSIEARVPYLDHQLVEMVWNWPNHWKIKGNIQKYILKKAYTNNLPREIINRPKVGRGGSQPIFPIIYKSGLERMIIDSIHRNRGLLGEWFDFTVIREIIDGTTGTYPVIGTRIREKLLYWIFLFCIWHETFIERNARGPCHF